MQVTPVPGKVFGAIVTEVALDPLTDGAFAEIHAAFLKYGFLLFPGQFLSDEGSAAFGARFGELEFAASPDVQPGSEAPTAATGGSTA